MIHLPEYFDYILYNNNNNKLEIEREKKNNKTFNVFFLFFKLNDIYCCKQNRTIRKLKIRFTLSLSLKKNYVIYNVNK
jgi:hypothetical protein